jgi:Predicted Fe-S oxidoreductase
MFIEDVVTKIWEPVSEEYAKIYDEAAKHQPDELFNLIIDEVKKVNNVVFQSRGLNMTMLATSGCPHNNRNGKFSGCSMCDYNSNYVEQLAMMSALKHKDPQLYARAIRFSFDDKRGKTPTPGVVELISSHDCLNPEEMPDEVFDEVLGKDDLFRRKPYKTIFETRVSSITYDKLAKWKEKLGKKVAVEFGIEVHNEWVRNHWINKNISDDQIISAINIIKETGCESSANILIGIPGFTEEHSIQYFKDSFLKLHDMGTDYILCSPLSRKKRTLQGFLYENFRNNTVLEDRGLVCGEHTGMPSIFTTLESICEVMAERPEAVNSITLSPSNFPIYFENIKVLNQSDVEMAKCTDFVIQTLIKFGGDKNINALMEARNSLKNNACYQSYLRFKEKQKAAGSLPEAIYTLGVEIAKALWPEEWDAKEKILKGELKLLHC